MKFSWLASALLAGSLFAAPALAQSDAKKPLSPEQEKAVQGIIKQYILDNPEVIIEAVESLRKKQEAMKAEQAKQALDTQKAALYDDKDSPVGGNVNGDVTIVEFFDYQCPYCKRAHVSLTEAVAKDGKIKIIYKEFPILSEESRIAAVAALAARNQGKYLPFHNALLSARDKLTAESIFAIAKSAGLDVDKLRKDMQSPEIGRALERNMALADALNIRGTPAFIVGREIVPGAIDVDTIRELVKRAREKKG
ncbi:MAG: DsbA family protein [Alphaproteobacteria bacterium]